MSGPNWPSVVLDRLRGSVNPDDGCAYRPGLTSCAESTALACLATVGLSSFRYQRHAGLRWLADRQRADGSVPNRDDPSSPAWTTGLAAIAWCMANDGNPTSHKTHAGRAIQWLAHAHGLPVSPNPDYYGHDTTLIGWSWVEGTHSWVEPTAYAVMALRAKSQTAHPRAREGVQLLLDRTIPGGGWNYGNSKVLGNTLRPFPETTGLVLCALAGETRDVRIDESIAFLKAVLPHIRTPLSLGWGLMGLSAWNERPDGSEVWLEECAARCADRPITTMEHSVLLLAAADHPVSFGALADVDG